MRKMRINLYSLTYVKMCKSMSWKLLRLIVRVCPTAKSLYAKKYQVKSVCLLLVLRKHITDLYTPFFSPFRQGNQWFWFYGRLTFNSFVRGELSLLKRNLRHKFTIIFRVFFSMQNQVQSTKRVFMLTTIRLIIYQLIYILYVP